MASKLARRYLRQRGLHLLNQSFSRTRKGQHEVSFGTYAEALQQAHQRGGKAYAQVNGWSPGFVARLLGMTRQAVYNAIERGTLTAYWIHDDDGSCLAIVVTEASVRQYAERNGRTLAA